MNSMTSAGAAKQRQRFGLDEWPVILEDEHRMLELLKHGSLSDYMQIWMPLSKDSNSDKGC